SCSYVLEPDQEVGFELGSYDRSRPLVIDPVLVYSIYLGGSKSDAASSIAIDAAGDAYVVGTTDSSDFPVAGTPYQSANHGSSSPVDGGAPFVAKLGPTGARIYSTYLGGSDSDFGGGIALDAAGNAFITGLTASTDFPTVNPLQPSLGGRNDVFVA